MNCTQHVIIVSDQPAPNLIPVIMFQPETVHLLVSSKMTRKASRIRAYLESRGINAAEHPIEAYNMEQVKTVCSGILSGAAPGSVLLNATGGTKLAALGAFAAFRDASFPVVYFDPETWQIRRIDSGHPPEQAKAALTVREYLAIHGLNVSAATAADEGMEKRNQLTSWLAEHLPKTGFIRTLNAFSARAIEKRRFPFTEHLHHPVRADDRKILEKLHSGGMLKWDPKVKSITFEDYAAAHYLCGFWFEEYVFETVKSLGADDILMNVNVEWDNTGDKPLKNELDVVFTHNCRLFLISCKTSKLATEKEYKDKNPVYELDSIKDTAAGLFGRGMLVSATPISHELKKRADSLDLLTIAGPDLPWIKAKIHAAMNFR